MKLFYRLTGRPVPPLDIRNTARRQGSQQTRKNWFPCAIALLSSMVQATETTFDYALIERMEKSFELTPLTTEGLGDKVDHSSGLLKFETVDITIPGNFALPVELRREYTSVAGVHTFESSPRQGLADWSLKVPKITYNLAAPGYSQLGEQKSPPGFVDNKQCSGNIHPVSYTTVPWAGFATYSFNFITPEMYTKGPQIDIPGVTSETVLPTTAFVHPPGADVDTYRFSTHSNIRISCVSQVDGNGNTVAGEGFLAQTADGTSYYFNLMREYGYGAHNIGSLRRYEFLATRVEDRFGNRVNYHYSPDGAKLNSITASDGRSITFTHDHNQIETATANGRVWTYVYEKKEAANPDSAPNKLTAVQLPTVKDDSGKDVVKQWTYSLPRILTGDVGSPTQVHDCENPRATKQFVFEVTHPEGLKGIFLKKWMIHGVANIDAIGNRRAASLTNSARFAITKRRCHPLPAIVQKSLTSGHTWHYSYSQNEGIYNGNIDYNAIADLQGIPANLLNGTVTSAMKLTGTLPQNIPAAESHLYKWTQVTHQGNHSVKYYFNRDHHDSVKGAKQVAEQHFNHGVLSQEIRTEYERGAKMGGWMVSSWDTHYEDENRRIKKVETDLVDTTNTNLITTYTNETLTFNEYNLPVIIQQYNNALTQHRYIKQEYWHNTTKWILNQPQKVLLNTTNNFPDTLKAAVEYTYPANRNAIGTLTYADLGLIYEQKRFGRWLMRHNTWHSDGNVKKTEFNTLLKKADGSNDTKFRYREITRYHRGQPTRINYPARYAETGVVYQSQKADDNGWITSIRDFNGHTTNYGYDELGRLTWADLPDSWLDYHFTWPDQLNRVTTGLPPIRSVSRCTLNVAKDDCTASSSKLKETQTFNLLLQLTQLSRQDVVTGKTRVQTRSYNDQGQKTFESFWLSAASTAQGTSYRYDNLNRLRQIIYQDNSRLLTEYQAGNKIRVTNPRTHITTTTYQAWGTPAYDRAILIASPEGVTTTLNVNIYGDILSIEQKGKNKDGQANALLQTEYRAYDSLHNLCKVVRKDTGTTLFTNSVLGEVLSMAQGVTSASNTNCTATSTPTNATVSFTYDNLGSPWKSNFADSSPDLTYTYDNNGNLKALMAGTVSHAYHYNSMNLLTRETLTVAGRRIAPDTTSPSLIYDYDTLGGLSSLTYPDGDVLSFSPNAFGQPTQVKRQARTGRTAFTYADKVVWYPGGQLNTFKYGNPPDTGTDNRLTHKTTLNALKLPKRLKDAKADNTRTALDYEYTYDHNLNVTRVLDHVSSAHSLGTSTTEGLFYDALDRLTSTTGGSAIGSSVISYDGLGNITGYKSKDRDFDYIYDANNRLKDVNYVSPEVNYKTFTYDDRGNITGNGFMTFTYNRANQMTRANSGNYRYLYDGHSRRVRQTDSQGTAYSLYSQGGTLLYRESNGQPTNYIYLGKKLIAKDGYIKESGTNQHYRPYGESIEGAIDDVGYTGHKFDKDLGLSYMQARYYDPVIGRFYSNDPIDTLGHMERENPIHGFNRYAYVNNNPYKYVDPDGQIGVLISPKITPRISPVAQGVRTGIRQNAANRQAAAQNMQRQTDAIIRQGNETARNSKGEIKHPSLKEAPKAPQDTTRGILSRLMKQLMKNMDDLAGAVSGADVTNPDTSSFTQEDVDTLKLMIELGDASDPSANNPQRIIDELQEESKF